MYMVKYITYRAFILLTNDLLCKGWLKIFILLMRLLDGDFKRQSQKAKTVIMSRDAQYITQKEKHMETSM